MHREVNHKVTSFSDLLISGVNDERSWDADEEQR